MKTNPSSRKTLIVSFSFLLSTIRFGKCIKKNWHLSGLLMKSTYIKIWKIGNVSMTMNATSLNTFLPSSLLLMVLFLKILLNNLCAKSKFLKLVHFMDFKSLWKTFTLKLTLFWLILTLKMKLKNYSSSKLLKMSLSLTKKLNGLLKE